MNEPLRIRGSDGTYLEVSKSDDRTAEIALDTFEYALSIKLTAEQRVELGNWLLEGAFK